MYLFFPMDIRWLLAVLVHYNRITVWKLMGKKRKEKKTLLYSVCFDDLLLRMWRSTEASGQREPSSLTLI